MSRTCLKSYTTKNVLKNHKQQGNQQEKTSIRTLNDSHLYWKRHFHKNPLYFPEFTDFIMTYND